MPERTSAHDPALLLFGSDNRYVSECQDCGGRVSNAAMMGANILKLKPVIELKDGQLTVRRRFADRIIAVSA